ncbi:MAG: Gfo/Idh/MocA family oxidoreductase [Gammaproteobacteria bacterium]|nr:Gfo/Idh/MocA family oxidoreductase [Gammaproteobacteria bacterium]MDH3447993.1 Gfo/Idh/MocA family oxidoreductase [Gammaproteobacteria bacterium]
MYLYSSLLQRQADNNPVRVGLIGAGKFGSMFLSQVPTSPGIVVTTIADLDLAAAQARCTEVGWDDTRVAACEFTEDAEAMIRGDNVDVVVEATGHPAAGIKHALLCIEHGKHVVMVNVEADVLAGPLLASRAREADVVYSMAYGDQPALTMEMVDWARCCGFHVVAAGKGTKYLPDYHQSTPDTVWSHYGLSAEQAAAAGMRSQMFNSFLDGTKSAIEMAAIANAAGLQAPNDGLAFPPCGVDDLAQVLRPVSAGGRLEFSGQVEVVSSLERNGEPVPRDLRWGVYCVFEAPNDYAAACFKQYGMNTDDSGRYSAMFKPFHLIGLELNISILSAALHGQPTGAPVGFNGDVAAVAKRDLKPGEVLDGEGGYTVWGKLIPATASVAMRALPIGLASEVRLGRKIRQGQVVTLDDIEADTDTQAWRVRAKMVEQFS